MKIVINKCFGGFGLSYKGVMRYAEIKGMKLYAFTCSASPHSKCKPYKEGNAKHRLMFYSTEPVKDEEFNDNTYFDIDNIERNDLALIQTVEELRQLVDGRYAELKVVEIPDDAEWQIEEYDGLEHVAEKHRTWS